MIKTKKLHVYLVELIQSEAAIVPIKTAFYLLYLSTTSDISLYKLIFSFAIFSFELPTGYLADKYSNKLSVIISIVLSYISLLLMILKPCFTMFIFANIFSGVANALISGSKNSFLMKFSEENELDYQMIKVKAAANKKIYELILMLLSGYLFSLNPRFPFFITLTIYFISFVLVLNLKTANHFSKPKELPLNFIQSSKLIFKEIWVDKTFRDKLLYFVIVSSLLISNFDFYNIYFKQAGLPIVLYGSIYASFMLLGFAGVILYKKQLSKKTHLLMKLALPVSFILISIPTTATILIAIILQQLMFAFCSIEFEISIIQSVKKLETSSQHQSIVSFIYSLFRIILLCLITGLLHFLQLPTMCILYAIVISIATFLFSNKG